MCFCGFIASTEFVQRCIANTSVYELHLTRECSISDEAIVEFLFAPRADAAHSASDTVPMVQLTAFSTRNLSEFMQRFRQVR